MMKEIFLFSVLTVLTLAEPPVSGPYPPSGWRPKGAPFTLPREFLPQQATDVEVTKERVEHAGQLSETTTTTVLPNNSYLPPEDEDGEDEEQGTEDLLKVQGLPSNTPNTFNQGGDDQLNQQEYFPPQARNNNFPAQNNRQSGQLRQQQQSRQQQQQFAQRQFGQQQFGRIRQQQQFGQFNNQQQPQFGQFNNQQQPQFGQLNEQQFGQTATQQQQFGQANAQQFPQNTQQQQQPFGPESTQFRKGGFIPQFGPRQTPTQEYGPPKNNNEDVEDGDEALANGAQSGQYNFGNNESEESEQPAVGTVMALSNGRYYVLTPDNTLQRVIFMTTQDQEEARTKGFTAQLRYMPVEPIRDPIYAYNEEGQLIRIFKK